MFDSENNSLVTRVEAGLGIIVSHNTNSEGENVWTATLDSDYVAALVTNNAGGILTLSATDEARLAEVEARLGIGMTAVVPETPLGVSGMTGTTEIRPFLAVAATTGTTKFTYSLVSFDGTVLADQDIVATTASTSTHFALALWSQIRQNNAMLLHMETPVYTDGKITITWKAAHQGSTIRIAITESTPSDGVAFDVQDY